MEQNKTQPHFSRKLLAIPYGLFLAIFVVIPLLIILYYAFVNDEGKLTLEYVRMFFNESGEGFLGFFRSYTFKTIMQSLFISVSGSHLSVSPLQHSLTRLRKQLLAMLSSSFTKATSSTQVSHHPIHSTMKTLHPSVMTAVHTTSRIQQASSTSSVFQSK